MEKVDTKLKINYLQILKDITLRNKLINRQKVHYVPGWDCHGLPIELKALNETKSADGLTPLQIRELGINKNAYS